VACISYAIPVGTIRERLWYDRHWIATSTAQAAGAGVNAPAFVFI
jgi:hypothetical protein